MLAAQSIGRACALLALVASAGSCASAPAHEGTAAGATLEVENRTAEDLLVSVRGRSEGVARSGTRLRIRNLPAGEALVSARARSGGPEAFEQEARVVLRAGARAGWTVLPDAAGGEPLPEVPGLAALIVENPTTHGVAIVIDGVRLGRVLPGERRRFDDLPSGARTLIGEPDGGGASTTAELLLAPESEAAWRFELSGARLEVVNGTDEAIALSVDGAPRGRVGPGERWQGVEAPGLRVLAARSEPSRRPFETALELSAEATTVWEVTLGQAVLAIENETGEALQVEVPGQAPAPLSPREVVRFEGLATGPIAVRAIGVDSKLVYASQLELLPAQTVTWVAGAISGTVRVENRTTRAVTVYARVDGAERERGQVQPGAVALVRNLPRTNVRLTAIADGVPRRHETTIDLSDATAATWVVSGIVGAVRVESERDEALEVFVDGRRVGDVPAREARTFTGVEVGERLIECVGRKSGSAHRDRLHVPEEGLVTTRVSDVAAFVEIENASGEAVAGRGPLADQAERVETGASVRVRVRAGKQKLAMAGAESGLVYTHGLEVAAGETARWTVRREPGTLIVWSRLAETVAVTIDDRAQGTLPPDETLAIGDLAPGPHRVQVVGLRTGQVRSEAVRVSPGGEVKVTFATELAVLLVENRAQERVEVSIDGALYGHVEPGTLHAFGKVAPGAREVELWFMTSERTQKVALELREGQRGRIVAEAPMGLLVVDNRARQDIRLTIDGQPLAVVAADAGPTLVNAPAGKHLVQIRRLGDKSELGFQLEVHADSAIHLPVPGRSVRLVVVNRTGQTLSLWSGERRLADVAPKSSEMFEEVPEGATRLFARDAEGRITHEEQRRLHAGETATWVLDEP